MIKEQISTLYEDQNRVERRKRNEFINLALQWSITDDAEN